MRKLKVVMIWFVAIFVAFFVLAYVGVGVWGKGILQQQIEKNLKVEAKVKGVFLSFPFAINIDGFELKDLAVIKRISFTPNILGLLMGKIVLNGVHVIQPVITVQYNADGSLNLPVLEQGGNPPSVYVTGIQVKDGKVIFTDEKQ